MPLISAKCTNCGCVHKVDSAKDAAICPDCNAPYIVEKAILYFYTGSKNFTRNENYGDENADALYKSAQDFIQLGAFEDASKKYKQMMTSFPMDARGSIGVVQLCAEHHTSLIVEGTQLQPLKVALQLGDKDFLDWLYQYFDNDIQLVDAGVVYYKEIGISTGNQEFIFHLNQHFEKMCKKVRRGECHIEKAFGNGEWETNWDEKLSRMCGELRLYCDCMPSVKALLNEAKENMAYFKTWINKIGFETYKQVALGVIKRLWEPTWCNFDYSSSVFHNLPIEDGGLIGNQYYHGYDRDHGLVPEYMDLKILISKQEIDKLFHEISRCAAEPGLCPYCGIGKRSFFSNKCKHCGAIL